MCYSFCISWAISNLDGFVVDDDSEDEDIDYEVDTTDEDEPMLIPNTGGIKFYRSIFL